MAVLISVERAALALGTAQVLDGVSLGVSGGDRIGIVGRNGGGKTTLLRVLAAELGVDSGRVARLGGATVGEPMAVLTQEALASIGIKVQLNKLPGATWRAALLNKDLMGYRYWFHLQPDYRQLFRA